MSKQSNIAVGAVAGILITAALTVSAPVQSSEAGAFIGGVAASRVMSNMRRRTEAEEVQATIRRVPRSPCNRRLLHLQHKRRSRDLTSSDKLAAGGYITPQVQGKEKVGS